MKTESQKMNKTAVGQRKKEKNEVAKLLSRIQKKSVWKDLVDEVPLRMIEMNSLLQIVHAAIGDGNHDASFYRKHVGQTMFLIEKRFDELQIMVDALVDKEWDAMKEAKKTVG